MIVTDLFVQINSAFRGSDDDPPTTGTDFDLWIATANRKQSEWARDAKKVWKSLFDVRNIGTISAGNQVYDLDDEIIQPSDRVTVTNGANVSYFTFGEPQERDRFSQSVYISGRDPQQLTFNDTIIAGTGIVGGTINVAGYYMPDELTDGSSTISVDDPYWLVYAVASELAFNDDSYENKYQELNNKANNLYTQMAAINRRGSNNNPRTARYNVNRILSPETEGNY